MTNPNKKPSGGVVELEKCICGHLREDHQTEDSGCIFRDDDCECTFWEAE